MCETLGDRLRECRKGLKLPVREVAELIGVHRQTLYRWEWGAIEPELKDLCALADLYAAPMPWLVRGEGSAPAYLLLLRARGGDKSCKTGS
jgi:transcriptional regulator with XRE-family HTH domain